MWIPHRDLASVNTPRKVFSYPVLMNFRHVEAEGSSHNLNRACDKLYQLHQVSLVKYARQRGCDEHEAWDVVQELFLRVFRLGMIPPLDLRPVQAQRAWLFRTLRWMLINLHRHRSSLRRGGGMTLESLERLVEQGGDFPAASTPANDYDRQWAASILERCLSRLRLNLHPCSWSAFESAFDNSEAPGAPATRVAAHRARVRLRQMIRVELRGESLMQAVYR